MLKTLSKSIREFKKDSILSPIFVMIEVVMDIAIPFVMNFLLKYGIQQGSVGNIWLYGGLLILMTFIALLFGALSGVSASRASCGFARNLRKDMYYNIQNFSFSNVDKFSSSSLITRMTTDVTYVQNAYQMIIRVAVRCPFMLIFALIMSFIIGGKLALIYCVVVPIMFICFMFILKLAHKTFKSLFKKYDKLNAVVEENIRGMRVVKSNVSEDVEVDKFEDVSQNIYNDFTKAQKIIALNNPIMQLTMYVCIVFISFFSAKIIINTQGSALTITDLQTLITYTSQILMSLMFLSGIFAVVTISRASAERICEVLNEDSHIKNPEKPTYSLTSGKIEFKNVNFSYSNNMNKLCLKNINLTIESGETIGIIGGTGSGKTSLVSLIPRLYDVTNGEVFVGGENVKNYDITTLRSQVAMVLQKNVLFSGTIRDNIKWGKHDATDEEIIHALKLSEAYEFVQAHSEFLDRWVEQGGANFSGGQKQRLCIARALIANPKILILDDSTSAVDTATDLRIRQAFKEFIPNTTKIIIAQRVASVINADKIIVLDGGAIVGEGTHESLMDTCQIYQEVYNSQIGGGDFDETAD